MKLAAENDKIVGITAAMPDGTGMNKFAKTYPNRFYDVGIAEAHAVTFAAALASRGIKPVFAVYSTFLQRGFDQVFHDICLANVPVVLAVDRAGIVGDDGETHQGLFDLAYLRTLPNMNILAPRDGQELLMMMDFAVALDKPVAVRYPRGGAPVLDYEHPPLQYGKGQILIDGDKDSVGLLAVGLMVSKALQAADILNNNTNGKKKVAVADLRFAKPLDEELIVGFAEKYKKIAVLEDGVISGGAGAAVLEVLAKRNVQAEVELFAFPDEFIPQGKPKQLFDAYGLSAEKIAKKIDSRWF